jgi:hypothetical protein
MDWVASIVPTVVVLLLLGPLAMLLGGILVLVLTNHLRPAAPTVNTATFDCPFSRHHVTAEFVTPYGFGRPTDVLACSAFADPHHIRCKKGCLGLADTVWVAPAIVPRFALIDGGVAPRILSPTDVPGPSGAPPPRVGRAA